jgi:hypothetical protein
MSEPMTQTTPPSTCPSCGATVRQDVPWCLQCYASLQPESPVAQPSAGEQPVADEPTGAPAAPTAQDALTAAAEADRVADELLARLAYEDRQVNWVARLEQFPGGRTGAIAAGIVVAGLVVLVALTLLGLVL